MNASLLATKFFLPPPRSRAVLRRELCRRLDENLLAGGGFARKLTLVSAPPGFGKTTIASEWLAALPIGKAWLSLDETDKEPARFLACLVSALQTAVPTLGAWVLGALQSPQPPSSETLLTRLVNDLVASGRELIVALDDYHSVGSPSVDGILVFLLDNLPLNIHIVLLTREDPGLPLARYRASDQMTELRAKDLRFSYAEVADFFGRTMDIALSEPDLAALEARTEGWAAGLQFAALALQGNRDKEARSGFIASFTGSHRFVLDYLVEEVLLQRTEDSLKFLLGTSCLGRFCGELCDAVFAIPAGSGGEALAALDRANLFLVPLDSERSWYRYHHLFAELLQRRLATSLPPSCPDPSLIHARASRWFEEKGFIVEAFRHAAASGDTARTESLITDRRMPTHIRETMMEVIDWLVALPDPVKNERPSLWVKSANFSLMVGQTAGVEERLKAAESALRGKEDGAGLLFGQIATARATLALSQYRFEEVKRQAGKALELLGGQVSPLRMAALYDLGVAQQYAGDRAGARRSFEEVLSQSRSCGAVFFETISAIGLGEMQESDNDLLLAAETFRHALDISGEHPQPSMCEAYLGLARIHYEWNDLETAALLGEQGLVLARQYDRAVDRFLSCEVFLSRIEMVRGDLGAAERRLAQAEQTALAHDFPHRIPEIRAAQALLRLRLGSTPQPDALPPPLQVRILLARGRPETASGVLDAWAEEVGNQKDGRLRALVLGALVLEANKNHEAALGALAEALGLAQDGGHLRLFVDEGQVMRHLLEEARERGPFTAYADRILAAFPEADAGQQADREGQDILSDREREVILLLAEGMANQEIADRLYLSLHTIKVHVRNIFAKLGTTNRTAAVAKARSLGLLP